MERLIDNTPDAATLEAIEATNKLFSLIKDEEETQESIVQKSIVQGSGQVLLSLRGCAGIVPR